MLQFLLGLTHLLIVDKQVNSVHDNYYRDWRGGSRRKRAAIAPEVDGVALPTGRRPRVAQLVPGTRFKRSDYAGTKFEVNAGYQPADGISFFAFNSSDRVMNVMRHQ